jgi:hypothetical protein
MSFGSDKDEIKDSKPEIPDEVIDPMMKERPKSSKDRSFEKNKLAGWDEDSEEKVKKEVDVDSGDDEEDEFDDFDYRDNTFGDEEDDDDFSEDDDDERSEDEKLKDAIDDAIDSLGDGDASGDDFDDDDSGANWGDDGDDEQQGDGQQGGNSGDDSQSGKMSGGQMDGEQQSGGKQDGQQGESNPNSSDSGSQSSTKDGGGRETISQKQKRLNELKKSLESDSIEDFDEKIQDVKNSTNAPEDNTIGGHIETPSDETFKEDMKKGGFNDETIDEMTQKKNTDTNSEYSEEEMEKLILLYQQGVCITEIAGILHRNEGGITSRLKKLGLMN